MMIWTNFNGSNYSNQESNSYSLDSMIIETGSYRIHLRMLRNQKWESLKFIMIWFHIDIITLWKISQQKKLKERMAKKSKLSLTIKHKENLKIMKRKRMKKFRNSR